MSARARLAWVAGGVSVAAAVVARRLRGREEGPTAADHANELRRRLDESRALTQEREEFESGETTVDQAEPAMQHVDERRRQVHEQGRAAIDELGGRPEDEGSRA